MSTSRPSSIHSTTSSSAYHPSSALLHPEDAIYSPPRRPSSLARQDTLTATTNNTSRKSRRNRSSSRRRRRDNTASNNGQWKKLLWVKQSYPDNYTDEETFLDHLQRNPRLRPYEFWPLVADSTIIVQHLCSVVIFVCCFTGIFQERVRPESVVGWATGCTVAGWVFRDYWQGISTEDEDESLIEGVRGTAEDDVKEDESTATGLSSPTDTTDASTTDIPATLTGLSGISRPHSRAPSTTPSLSSPVTTTLDAASNLPTNHPSFMPPYNNPGSRWSPRTADRLTTAKSAILIYCSLLGLSPILKSLTLSTSSDSIWAISTWLILTNIFFFDYGAGPSSKFPASLSTNAALMASTVLASRLPSTTHVFSLTLFSIEVFGLFPVFRRHLRHFSWTGHLCLTASLVVVASGGLGMCVSGGGLVMAGVGIVLGSLVCLGGMGLTSWWLIGLQRYKNEIHGPWDPARPIIRGGWD